MPIQLTMCRLCTRSRPEFLCAVAELVASYPSEIDVVELECMAACDDVPAIMVETDYYPQVVPQDLIRLVRECLQLSTS
ncbi:NAD(P)H-dependent oxidoreductase subunit E [Oscillochloris sp. ZM17-4]|uniref:NAD(P)H-dependent oxidoreductase subunit E n=1 Tax=Oscillochloris sp. ZM17-4 TaxID=2866714 RepID=UPI001C73B7E1|nr:NAD(P)H-dependent oxidoreductase subunit E [Oscillochloris sp. ZM17-4]MBX0328166.1 NAD(P)H-dependent oxidoreductase subunit E [Oscillochloris sp. ZM17-4]